MPRTPGPETLITKPQTRLFFNFMCGTQPPIFSSPATVVIHPSTPPPPSLQDGSYGDLVITFKVVVPKTISSKQREVLEQFKAEEVEPAGAEPNGREHRQRY